MHNFKTNFRYAWSFTPSIFVLAGNLLGGHWAWSNMAYSLGLLVLLDFLVPAAAEKNNHKDETLPNALLWLASGLHLLCIVTMLWSIHSGILQGGFIWYAAASTGLNAGMLGITVAHELIHRKTRLLQFLGIANLTAVCYGHFFIEHRFGHHARVGTPADPATARFGESYYTYLWRSVPAQWLSAAKLEAGRLQRVGKHGWGFKNFVLRVTLFECALFIALWLMLSQHAALAWLMQSAVAIFLLEYVNYIQHYGLVRQKGEKVQPHHSWNSDSFLSRFFLFELSRHGHHHHDARVPYHQLNNLPGGSQQPLGYFSSFYLGLIPPLWFRLMNPVVQKTARRSTEA
jgi:alkane 1-monooxygenase